MVLLIRFSFLLLCLSLLSACQGKSQSSQSKQVLTPKLFASFGETHEVKGTLDFHQHQGKAPFTYLTFTSTTGSTLYCSGWTTAIHQTLEQLSKQNATVKVWAYESIKAQGSPNIMIKDLPLSERLELTLPDRGYSIQHKLIIQKIMDTKSTP